MHKRFLYGSLAVLILIAGATARAKVDTPEGGEASPSELMHKKLEHAQSILAALTFEDFDGIRSEAEQLSLISLDAHWRKDNPPSYAKYNADFQWAVSGLVKMAEEKNLEGATLKYNRVVASCVECHKAVRGASKVADTR